MKNYQRLNYTEYFIQKGDEMIPCTKAECFAPGEVPSLENPCKQRWYYCEERTMAIRLERSERGHAWYVANASSLKNEERWGEKFNSMVHIDAPHTNEDGVPFGFEIPCGGDVESIVMRMEELRILGCKLETLAIEQKQLWDMVVENLRKKDIAKYFELNLDRLYYKEKKLKDNIRSDEALQGWFEKE